MITLLTLTFIFGLMGLLQAYRADRLSKAPVSYGNPLPGTFGVMINGIMAFVWGLAAAACGIAAFVTWLYHH